MLGTLTDSIQKMKIVRRRPRSENFKPRQTPTCNFKT